MLADLLLERGLVVLERCRPGTWSRWHGSWVSWYDGDGDAIGDGDGSTSIAHGDGWADEHGAGSSGGMVGSAWAMDDGGLPDLVGGGTSCRGAD